MSPAVPSSTLALELERLAREAAVHERLRELFLAFTRSLSSLSIEDALASAAVTANGILDARLTAVWLHDRRARHLTLAATSQGLPAEPTVVPTTDPASAAAHGLRLDGPVIAGGPGDRTLIAPLRGWRRALGTLVIDGRFAAFDDQQLLEFARQLAQQLAVGIENVLLIQEVLKQRERLSQSEKLASLGQFVAGIAHEMNNPLQGVLGHLELMMTASPQARPLRPQLKRIYHDAERAAQIVRNLLAFTGSHRITRRRIAVDRVLSRAISSRGAALRSADVQVVRRQGKGLPHVAGDALLLQQAFLNVLINAEHAIAAGPARDGRIEVVTKQDRARKVVVTTIRDSGPGIPGDVLPRIFDPFFTTKEVGKGTGLGLAITYGILQEHGGAIHAASPPGGGALFTIELPSAQ